MRSPTSHYHGRGGARLLMPRPRIESEAWIEILQNDLANWRIHLRRIPALLLQTRFFIILAFILVIILFNYLLSSHYHREIHGIKIKADQQKKLRLVLQYQAQKPPKNKIGPEAAAKLQTQTSPQPKPKPKPVIKKPKPKSPQPVAKPKPQKPNPVVKPKPITRPKPPKPKPEPKKMLNLEASLNQEKKLSQPVKSLTQPRTRHKRNSLTIEKELNLAGLEKHAAVKGLSGKRQGRKRSVVRVTTATSQMQITPRISEEKVFSGNYESTERTRTSHNIDLAPESTSLQITPQISEKKVFSENYDSTGRTRTSHNIDLAPESKQMDIDLNVAPATEKFTGIVTAPDRITRTASVTDRQSAYAQEQEEPEIEVDIQDSETYNFPMANAEPAAPPVKALKRVEAPMTGSGNSEITFAETGTSLIQLKTCGPQENKIKHKLAKLVQKNGYSRECTDQTGKYQFHWPAKRFTVQNFNVIIFTSQGRIATDRCEELNNACECLKNK